MRLAFSVVSDPTGRQSTLRRILSFPLPSVLEHLFKTLMKKCDSRIRIEQDHDFVPVPTELDSNGAPTGILTGLGTCFIFGTVRTTGIYEGPAECLCSFGGIRVCNVQITFVRPVGLDPGKVDSWKCFAK
jgi:hypothetical protein